MDDNRIKDSLAGFNAVWRRVTGTEEARPDGRTPLYDEEDALARFIRDELCAASHTASLARMFQGSRRAVLLRHAAEASRHARHLRAEYFIRTGAMPEPGGGCRRANGKLASLRAILLQDRRMADGYENAAYAAGSAELRQLYQTFAADARRQAQEIRILLIESF